MNWKFWKQPPSLNCFDNFPPKRRRIIVVHEIISGTALALFNIWQAIQAAVYVTIGITAAQLIGGALIVGSIVYSFSQAKKLGKQKVGRQNLAESGHLLNTQATTEPLPVQYGKERIGGNRVYINATGTDNEFIHIILTISEGPVKGIKVDGNGDIIYLDGVRIQDFSDLAYWEFFRGTGDQNVCATLQAADPNWDDAMRWTAYLYLRLKYNQDKFSNLPDITLELEGREIYDPRNGQTIYSDNPALVSLDFLRNDRYSLGIPLTLINADLVKDVANWTDTNGYKFNGSIMERKPLIDNLDDILRNFRTGIIWSEGEYKMFVYEYDTPVMELTENDIIADSFKTNLPGIPETPNRVLMTYPDIVDNYISKTRIIEDPNAVLLYDLEERDFELELIGTTAALQATKLGNYYLERNRLNRQHSLTCHPRVLALEPMDMIQITHSLPGWTEKVVRVLDMDLRQDGLVQLSILEEYAELYDDDVNVTVHVYWETNLPNPLDPPPNVTNLELEEATDKPGIIISFTKPGRQTNWDHAKIFISIDGVSYNPIATVYTDDPFIFHDVIPGQKYWIKIISYSFHNIPSTNPPVESIEILTEGLRPPRIRGLELFGQGNDTEWKGRDAKFAWRPIALKSGAGVNFADQDLLNAGQGFPDAAWQDYKIEIWVGGIRVREEYTRNPYYNYTFEKNLEDNGSASNTITIKIWNRSAWNIMSNNPAVLEVTNPVSPMPTGITTWAIMNGVKLTWSPSVAVDHDYWTIRAKVATGTWSSWISIDNLEYIRMLLKAEIEAYGLFPQIYFELKDVDTFGNQSTIASANAACFAIAGLSLEDLSILAGKLADNAVETAKLNTLAVTEGKIAALAVTADKIGANAVTSDKIYAGAITTEKITAGAVVGDKIAANVISAGHILAGAIETEKLAALAVIADKIAANTITADKMNVTQLSAISANIGDVTAGIARSSDSTFKIDFTSKWLKVWDASSVLRVHIGDLG